MNLEAIATECQICHRAMTVEIELNPLFSIEKLTAMATCDRCYAKRCNPPKKNPLTNGTTGAKRQGMEVRQPYAD